MRDKKPPDPPEDVPFWFITYSDVITLLMTFFILLLTFATNEPEMFERMQVSMFGGGGATGIAGPPQGPLEKDTIVLRQRPKAARLTTRGSEMPPMHSDASVQSLAAGLAGLEDADHSAIETSHVIEAQLSLLIDSQGVVTSLGRQRLRMIARQLRKSPYQLVLQVSRPADAGRAIALAQHLTEKESVPSGKVGVGVAPGGTATGGTLKIILVRQPAE